MSAPPTNYASAETRRQLGWRRRVPFVFVAVLSLVVGLPALLIGGLLLINLTLPPRSADAQLRADLGVGLPQSARQIHGRRLPGSFIDPATHYALQLAPADVPAWIAGIQAAANAKGWSDDVLESISGRSAPAWWTPTADVDVTRLTLANTYATGHGFTIFYSPTSGRVFVFWWAT